ncbi:MAG: Polyphosphate kinase [Gemmatimonadaceae bacterium]|nr:Polyphosphate kinase [Gemmatimonadaceae bacterium]
MHETPVAPDLFINRELSWLDFNARVLQEALDARTPLLERLKFLGIFSSNLDEFYMVRVAGLRRQVAAGVHATPPDGMSPQAQLDAVDSRIRGLLAVQRGCLHKDVLPALALHGIRIVGMDDVTADERRTLDAYFEQHVFPVLTPLAVDPGHPFPYISNLSLSLAVLLRDPEREDELFARVKVPRSLPRWVPLARHLHFVPLEDLIAAHVGSLFPGMSIQSANTFRITRYSDMDVPAPDEPDDLLEMIEEQILQRRFGEIVRLEVDERMPPRLRDVLLAELRATADSGTLPLAERDVFEAGTLLDVADVLTLAALEIPELRDTPYAPVTPPEVRDPERTIFDAMRERDLLVHHPFESFAATVENFLETAAADENVLAIKLTLYRTSGDTAIVEALTQAAQRGKQVAVLVELQARFDEINNINWARTLENFGVHVAYGVPGLKTHAKVALVVRRDPDGIRRYVHIGSGNYNSRTARIYTDLGLFTCHPAIGADVSELFNLLTGFSRQQSYRKLLVAPANLRDRLLDLIARETRNARSGKAARIVAKMNALVSPEVIAALYEASGAGVDIHLIVRGICCLRPGIPGVSDRIRVISCVGRFLEHSRIFAFWNGGEEEFFMGSADWMPRNLERRVEVVVPVEDVALHPRLRSLLTTYLEDNRQAWDLRPDCSYVQRQPGDEPDRGAHRRLLRDPWGMDRADSRYTTSEMRATTLPPTPEPRAEPAPVGNGKRRTARKRGPPATPHVP